VWRASVLPWVVIVLAVAADCAYTIHGSGASTMAVSGTQICVDGSGQICVDGSGDFCVKDITCNSCDPPLSSVYEVTISGCGGDFTEFNGTGRWAKNPNYSCVWSRDKDAIVLEASFAWDGAKWVLTVSPSDATIPATCYIDFHGPSTQCDPTGTYTFAECQDIGCNDTGSCEDNSSPVATVAEAN
jgi:hypothetical protein